MLRIALGAFMMFRISPLLILRVRLINSSGGIALGRAYVYFEVMVRAGG